MEVISPHRKTGEALLEDGSATVEAVADRLLNRHLTEEDSKDLSNALATLRSATNHLEGTSLFETAHKALDYAGRIQRIAFPRNCNLSESNGSYSQHCPVALAHTRIGLSIGGMVREATCSICDQDPDLCSHISGREYDGAPCYKVITEFDLDHVSFVEHPDFPDARITSETLSSADIMKALGSSPAPGTVLTCSRCLRSCSGVYRPSHKSK